jgi:hypothetical protein
MCTHAKREILHALRQKNDSADRVTMLYFTVIIMIIYIVLRKIGALLDVTSSIWLSDNAYHLVYDVCIMYTYVSAVHRVPCGFSCIIYY